MLEYRCTLSPGVYLFAPEILLGKMTGKIVEDRSEYPAHKINPSQPNVTLGFCPRGFVPKSLKGAPPSWLSEYPVLQGLEKLAEVPESFLKQLKRHVEERMRLMEQAGLILPARRAPAEEAVKYAADSPSLSRPG